MSEDEHHIDKPHELFFLLSSLPRALAFSRSHPLSPASVRKRRVRNERRSRSTGAEWQAKASDVMVTNAQPIDREVDSDRQKRAAGGRWLTGTRQSKNRRQVASIKAKINLNEHDANPERSRQTTNQSWAPYHGHSSVQATMVIKRDAAPVVVSRSRAGGLCVLVRVWGRLRGWSVNKDIVQKAGRS